MQLHTPVLNNNGDTKTTLLEGYRQIQAGLRDTLEALQNNAPHGRNYQTVSEDRFRSARAVFNQRVQTIRGLLDGIQKEAEEVYAQGRDA